MRNNKFTFLTALFLIACCSGASAQTYDPALFSVCPEQSCYVICPAGDISFCFCISYDGQPLLAPPSEVHLSIECSETFFCPEPEKASYLVTDRCCSVEDCGREYCWAFQALGCCENATLSLHMAGDSTSFYQLEVPVHTLDLNLDFYANSYDSLIVAQNYGSPLHCYDMNCSGEVDFFDTSWWIPLLCGLLCYNHVGHNFFNVIEAKTATWSSIKQIYKE